MLVTKDQSQATMNNAAPQMPSPIGEAPATSEFSSIIR